MSLTILALTLHFFLIFLPLSLSNNRIDNKITLVINEKGSQKIFSNTTTRPDVIMINGIVQNKTNNDMIYDLPNEQNIILLKWKTLLVSCVEMFKNLINIVSIDLSSFNSSKVTNMNEMFYNCYQLKSINFTNFDTSLVTNMGSMFFGTQLTSLNLSSFNTSSLEFMRYMFYECRYLQILDLSNFNTSIVRNMENLFYNDKNLISLDLSSFDTSSVSTMRNMFNGCNSLVYLNIKLFKEKEYVEISDIFSQNLQKLIYCIDKERSPRISSLLESKNYTNDCENICFSGSKIIPLKKKCIDDCNNDDTYKCEYNNICYETCPEIEDNPINTIFDDVSRTHSFIDDEISDIIINSDIITYNDDKTENESSDKEKSDNNGNSHNEIIKTEKVEMEEILYIGYFINASNKENNVTMKDEIIKKIKNEIISRQLDSLISNITERKEDLLIKTNDTIYQITTTENQKNNTYKDISTLDLGKCEDRLKQIYNIDKDLALIIFKVDYYKEGSLIPVICYEVYEPLNKSILDLNYCKDILINLNIPVSIDEDNLYKYNPNSEFYNDKCYAYTTENGTDIILIDRQNEYNDNNLSICENNCVLKGYNIDTKKVSCDCETKSKLCLISDVINDDIILSGNFNNTDGSTSNIVTMKCIDTLFSKYGLLTNIGNYILGFTLLFFIIATFIFYKCGYIIIEDKIKEILSLKLNNHKNKIDIFQIKKDYKLKLTKVKKKKKRKSKLSMGNPIKRKSLKKSTQLNYSKSKIKNSNIGLFNEKNTKSSRSIFSKENYQINETKYKECEMNFFNYKQALEYDKRTFIKYYLSLLKVKNLILFSFYPIDDYNIKIIKISLFLLIFDIYFAVNALFFNDSTIHQIYIDQGMYNLSYFIPQIIYSFIISYTISVIIKFFSLSERELLNLKNEENKSKNDGDNVKKCLVVKYFLFFLLSLSFLILFWYYLSCFCAVYINSQTYVIINTFISVLIALIYPFLFIIIPGIIRFISLNEKGNEFIYKLSLFIQYL